MARAAAKPLPAPDPKSIIHEVDYRGYRIVLTNDRRCVGASFPDKWGFAPQQGYVVLDEFDDHVFGVGMHWFYSPDDAASAIEMHDSVVPEIKEEQPHTTVLYEYGLMRAYRREFHEVYRALNKLQRMCDDAVSFEDTTLPVKSVQDELHLLRQNVARGRSIGE